MYKRTNIQTGIQDGVFVTTWCKTM